MQTQLLKRLQGVNSVVDLIGEGQCSYNNTLWHAVLVSPFCECLTREHTLQLFAQVLVQSCRTV